MSDAFAGRTIHSASLGSNEVIVAGTATAVPQHVLSRELVESQIGPVFSLADRRLDAVLDVIANSRIDRRYSIFPVEYLIEPRPLEQISKEYRDHSVCLGRRAAQQALARAGIEPQEVDLILTVSCTGFMIPSLDAYLAPELGLRANVRRLPITELGCAAGAAGLALAREYVTAHPDGTVLLVAVELPTLTFQRRDISQANLISAILFGDGAAAAVVTGKDRPGPRILDSESYLFPDSLDAMGFDLRDTGFHIVLSREVPQMIRERIGGLVDGFLARHSLTRRDLQAYILHPGGQKLLRFMEEELGLLPDQTQPSWDVLRDFGNLSSASVLFVLHQWLEQLQQPTRLPSSQAMTQAKTPEMARAMAQGAGPASMQVPMQVPPHEFLQESIPTTVPQTSSTRQLRSGDHALLAGFGPGFSAEMLLLQWT